jgi:hypothetical protein
MASAPLFRGWDGRLNASQDLPEASSRAGFGSEFLKELAISGHERTGPTDDESDRVVGVALVDEEGNTRKRSDVVFDGTECVIQPAGDFVGLKPLEVEPHSLDPVGLAGPDVLLLAAGGDFDLAAAQGLDIAHDGTDPAVEQAKREVFVAEQTTLLASLCGDAQDATAAQALNAMTHADLIVLVAGIEREPDGNLLAFRQRLAGGFFGGDDQKSDLAKAQLVVSILRADGEDLLDGRQDRLGDEGRAIGPLLDSPSEHAVEGLGIEASLTKLVLNQFCPYPYHERHLRVKP